MSKTQTQGSYMRKWGTKSVGTQGREGRKYKTFDFESYFKSKGNYLKKGDSYYDLITGELKTKQ